MTLSDQEVQEFIEAWRADFGEVLSPEAAHSEALRLIDFFAWMAEQLGRPIRRDDAAIGDAPTKP